MCPWKPEEGIRFSEAVVKGGWMLSGMGSKLMYKNSTYFQLLIHLSTTNLGYPKKKKNRLQIPRESCICVESRTRTHGHQGSRHGRYGAKRNETGLTLRFSLLS